MYFQVFIQMRAYVIQVFLLCHQDSYYWSGRLFSHQNQTQYFHLIPSQHLILIFMQEYLIHCAVNNIIIFLLLVRIIFCYGILPPVIMRYNFNVLRTKVSHDLVLTWWIPRTMYEIGGFWLTLWVVYISFSALDRALTDLGVSFWLGGFSSL